MQFSNRRESAGTNRSRACYLVRSKGNQMRNIIYLVGLIVIVVAIIQFVL